MVCVPCFILPVLLYIWHKFIQPIVLRYWNPWEKKDADGKVIKAGPEFPFECKGGVCPFVPGKNKNEAVASKDEPNDDVDSQNNSKDTDSLTSTAAKLNTEVGVAENKKEI